MSDKKHLAFPNKADAIRLSIGVMGIGTSGPLIALSAMPVLTLIFWRNLGGAIATFLINIKRLELKNREGFKWSAIAGVVLAAHFVGCIRNCAGSVATDFCHNICSAYRSSRL